MSVTFLKKIRFNLKFLFLRIIFAHQSYPFYFILLVLQICMVIVGIIGDSVELPKWLNSVSGTKKSAKSNPSCLVEGTLSIGWHWGFECSEC